MLAEMEMEMGRAFGFFESVKFFPKLNGYSFVLAVFAPKQFLEGGNYVLLAYRFVEGGPKRIECYFAVLDHVMNHSASCVA